MKRVLYFSLIWLTLSNFAFSQELNISLEKKLSLTNSVFQIAFSPDSKYLAATTRSNYVGIFDQNFNIIYDEDGPFIGYAAIAAFSPKGDFFAFDKGENRDIYILKFPALTLIQVIKSPHDGSPVEYIAFSPDGKFLATASADNSVKIYKFNGYQYQYYTTLSDHTEDVEIVKFSPDGRFLASGSLDNTVKIYQVNNGNFRLIQNLNQHLNDIYGLDFSKDGQYLVTGAFDNTIHVYRLVNNRFQHVTYTKTSESIVDIAFSPNGKYIATANWMANNASIFYFDGTNLRLIKKLNDPEEEARRVAFSPDGAFLAVASYDNNVYFYRFGQTAAVAGNTAQPSPATLPPVLTIDKINVSQNLLSAEDSITISLTIKNYGLGDAKDVYALINTNLDQYLDYPKKVYFPLIPKKGGSQTQNITIKAHHNLPTTTLYIDIQVVEPYFHVKLKGKRIIIQTQEFLKPQLQIVKIVPKEIATPNPDGKLNPNEQIGFDIYIQNLGQGPAYGVQINVKNNQNGVIFLGYTNENYTNFSQNIPLINSLNPGDYTVIRPSFFLNSDFTDNQLKLQITVREKYGLYGFDVVKNFEIGQHLSTEGQIHYVKRVTKPVNPTIEIKDIETYDFDLTQINNPTRNNTYAIIIGNSHYRENGSDLDNVDYAINDAFLFKNFAQHILGVPENHIIMETDLTSVRMKNLLNNLPQTWTSSNSVIYFYYAGHGTALKNLDESNSYLIPTDVSATESNIRNYAVPLDMIYQKISNNGQVSRAIILLDACFSAPVNNVSAVIIGVPKYGRLPKNIIQFSASEGFAYWHKEAKHGVFTYFLAKHLYQSKGHISYGQLFDKVKSEVENYTYQTYHQRQTPQVITSQNLKELWRNLNFGQ